MSHEDKLTKKLLHSTTVKRPPLDNEYAASYEQYHYASLDAGDVDPSYEMLRYVCRRFELNKEQCYWLAFLYATCYCGPTVFYIYNEFPDFELVDERRLEKWWAENRQRLYFQTDRRWVRSRNQWCDIFRSYKAKVGTLTQEQLFKTFAVPGNARATYDVAWREMSEVYQFGRFAMFLYLEAVHVVTGFNMRPSTMDMRQADSCRNGLALAIGRYDLNEHGDRGKKTSAADMAYLQRRFDELVKKMESEDRRNNVWNIETTLCAYKKYCLGKRWVGYYLDRQLDEIERMRESVPAGVDWSVLMDYRRETYRRRYLKEIR